MIYDVVYCADCKKPLKSVPTWLAGVNVRFSCDSCRQRHPRAPLGYESQSLSQDSSSEEDMSGEATEVIDDEPMSGDVEAEDSPSELEE